ncbi:unnamed protein product [Rangifer tarandus platyrhynchus]|uniref:Uncharacterized protein n=1 Tax=Rangifer tarandus platyrhynchus TaxID=3082113 RepID=A0AC59YFZ0_RANTA
MRSQIPEVRKNGESYYCFLSNAQTRKKSVRKVSYAHARWTPYRLNGGRGDVLPSGVPTFAQRAPPANGTRLTGKGRGFCLAKVGELVVARE